MDGDFLSSVERNRDNRGEGGGEVGMITRQLDTSLLAVNQPLPTIGPVRSIRGV